MPDGSRLARPRRGLSYCRTIKSLPLKGGPFALQFARVSKGNGVLAVALLILLSIVAVLFTPTLSEWLFPPGTGRVPFVWLLMLLLVLIIAPLLVGRALQRLMPEIAPKLGRFLGTLSIVIFIIGAVSTGRYKTPAVKSMGVEGLVAIIALTAGAWIIGWLLGGPEIRNRKVFAISTSMRNVGVFPDRGQLLSRHGGRCPHPGLQWYFDPDEYAIRAHHGPYVA